MYIVVTVAYFSTYRSILKSLGAWGWLDRPNLFLLHACMQPSNWGHTNIVLNVCVEMQSYKYAHEFRTVIAYLFQARILLWSEAVVRTLRQVKGTLLWRWVSYCNYYGCIRYVFASIHTSHACTGCTNLFVHAGCTVKSCSLWNLGEILLSVKSCSLIVMWIACWLHCGNLALLVSFLPL